MAQSGADAAEQVQYVAMGREKGHSLKPLAALRPFLRPYRLTVWAALLAMLIATGATLILPAMLGGLMDKGFSAAKIAEISHFSSCSWRLPG